MNQSNQEETNNDVEKRKYLIQAVWQPNIHRLTSVLCVRIYPHFSIMPAVRQEVIVCYETECPGTVIVAAAEIKY